MSSIVNAEIYRKRKEREDKEEKKKLMTEMDSPGGAGDSRPEFESDSNQSFETIGFNSLHLKDLNKTQIYRTNAVGEHIEAIDRNPMTGRIYVASSNYGNNFWEGYVHYYQSIEKLPMSSLISLNMRQSCGNHLIFTANNQLLAAYDSGSVIMFDANLETFSEIPAHAGLIFDMTVDRNSGTIMGTISNDFGLSLYKLDGPVLLKSFNPAHSSWLTCIDFKTNRDDVLLTGAKDGLLLIWDLNLNKPASKFGISSHAPTSIKWSNLNENQVYIGSEDGLLTCYDIRNFSRELSLKKISENKIHRIKNLSHNRIAIIAGNYISVASEKDTQLSYHGQSLNTTRITDLVELEDKIYTVGLNSQHIFQHAVN